MLLNYTWSIARHLKSGIPMLNDMDAIWKPWQLMAVYHHHMNYLIRQNFPHWERCQYKVSVVRWCKMLSLHLIYTLIRYHTGWKDIPYDQDAAYLVTNADNIDMSYSYYANNPAYRFNTRRISEFVIIRMLFYCGGSHHVAFALSKDADLQTTL